MAGFGPFSDLDMAVWYLSPGGGKVLVAAHAFSTAPVGPGQVEESQGGKV
jgi:hypothetical protein